MCVKYVFNRVGDLLSRYKAGKVPKAFKHIPNLIPWEEILYLTEPEKWSPNALYQATRIFSSNFGVKKAQRFYNLVLLPRIREDIQKTKRLHFTLYRALKKSLYKPAAFHKGILLPLCEVRCSTFNDIFDWTVLWWCLFFLSSSYSPFYFVEFTCNIPIIRLVIG